MNSKRFTLGIAALAAILTVGIFADTSSARSRSGDHRYGNQQAYQTLAPEKQAKYDTILDEFNTKMTPIRDQIWAKKTQLRALSGNPNTKPEDVSKLTSDIVSLREQYRKEAAALDTRMEKEVGIKTSFASMRHGGGRHMVGGGHKGGMMQCDQNGGGMNMSGNHGGNHGGYHNGNHNGMNHSGEGSI